MATARPENKVDPREARIWATLECDTPIQQVTYDEGNGTARGLSNRQQVYAFTRDFGESRKGRLKLLVVVFILVAVSVVVGSLLGSSAKDSQSSVPGFLSMDKLLSTLPEYSVKMAQTNASSPQAKTLAWLQSGTDYELYRLNQRYALGVLFYSTNGESWNRSSGWMSNTSECTWYTDSDGQICDESSRLLRLYLRENHLSGSIPRELELLTHLQKLEFYEVTQSESFEFQSFLSGSIYSELYVSRHSCNSICHEFIPLLTMSMWKLLMLQREAFQFRISRPRRVYDWFHPDGNVCLVLTFFAAWRKTTVAALSSEQVLPKIASLLCIATHSTVRFRMRAILLLSECYSGNLSMLNLLHLYGSMSGTIPAELYVVCTTSRKQLDRESVWLPRRWT
jgi:hypothetical protein